MEFNSKKEENAGLVRCQILEASQTRDHENLIHEWELDNVQITGPVTFELVPSWVVNPGPLPQIEWY